VSPDGEVKITAPSRNCLQPPGWTPEKTERLRPLLTNDENA
jgi:hypothetical protein